MNKNKKLILIIILVIAIITLIVGLIFNFKHPPKEHKPIEEEKKLMSYEEVKEFAQKTYGKDAEQIIINEEEDIYKIHVKSNKTEVTYRFDKNIILTKNEQNFMVFSSIFIEISDCKLKNETIVTPNSEEILKFSFD